MAAEGKDLVVELLSNPELKHEFINDPNSVLKGMGFDVEDGVEYRVLEDTKNIRHITIPYLEEGTLSINEELEKRRSKAVPLPITFPRIH
jgi:hypothetical protein